jgi:hypothetical protein
MSDIDEDDDAGEEEGEEEDEEKEREENEELLKAKEANVKKDINTLFELISYMDRYKDTPSSRRYCSILIYFTFIQNFEANFKKYSRQGSYS